MDAVLLRQPGFKKSVHVLTHPCFHGAALLPNDIEIYRNNIWLFIKPETILETRPKGKLNFISLNIKLFGIY